jgi:hypothetical protein
MTSFLPCAGVAALVETPYGAHLVQAYLLSSISTSECVQHHTKNSTVSVELRHRPQSFKEAVAKILMAGRALPLWRNKIWSKIMNKDKHLDHFVLVDIDSVLRGASRRHRKLLHLQTLRDSYDWLSTWLSHIHRSTSSKVRNLNIILLLFLFA